MKSTRKALRHEELALPLTHLLALRNDLLHIITFAYFTSALPSAHMQTSCSVFVGLKGYAQSHAVSAHSASV